MKQATRAMLKKTKIAIVIDTLIIIILGTSAFPSNSSGMITPIKKFYKQNIKFANT